ncbi:unnamed protein product [Orchesella dallaii]|uniref:Ionotropic glutamate receptor C-terminal domain-containing protein n=1 Tax=Orchesella dallaii TaxID=48710 RepID=A0ABP1QU85_9HEXA
MCSRLNNLELFHIPIFAILIFLVTQKVDGSSSGSKSLKQTKDNPKLVEDSVHDFIIKLVAKSFSNCSLIVVQDKYDNGQNVSSIISALQQNVYVIKFNHSETGNTNNTTIEADSIDFSNKISNTRKRSSFCSLAILYLSDVNPNVIHQIQNVIAPTFTPIIRKDEDHFIFITPPKYHAKLLLMRELPNRVKFKLAIGRLDNGDNAITSINFFGGDMGSPCITHFPSENIQEDFDYFPDFLWNLNGKLLKISLTQTRALAEAYLPAPGDGVNNGRRGKWTYLLHEFLMVKFNFTYTMFLSTGMDGNPGEGGTGLQLKNGTWIGITGDLLYGRADMGLAFANTPKRTQFIGFTDTYYDTCCLTFVTGQPSKVFSALALFWPFDVDLWGCLVCAVIVSLLIFIVVFKLVARGYLYLDDSWSTGILLQSLLSPLIEQDFTDPTSSTLRCFFAFWSFFAMIVNTLYRSKLVTLLAFPVLVDVPETFEQLAHSNFKVGFMKHGDSAYNTLAASTDPVYVKLIREMEIIRGVGLECLEKVVSQENYACIAYDFDVTYLMGRNFSDANSRKIVQPGARTYSIWLGIGTEANSIYRVNFGKVLGNTRPFHLADIWNTRDLYYDVKLMKLRWWDESNQTANAKGVQEESQDLTLKHLKSSFYLLIGGLIMCLLVFCYEHRLQCTLCCKRRDK